MLIDEFMPSFDAIERHQTVIQAPPASVYSALRTTDFGRPVLVKLMLAVRGLPAFLLRSGRGRHKARAPRSITLATFLDSGFALLSEIEDKEIVLGLVGRFWTLTGRLEETDAARFQQEARPGLAKAAWNFILEPIGAGTRVVTETRVQCTDSSSRWRFRAYWLVVRPFSGLLRRYMLRELRLASERTC